MWHMIRQCIDTSDQLVRIDIEIKCKTAVTFFRRDLHCRCESLDSFLENSFREVSMRERERENVYEVKNEIVLEMN